MHCSTNNDNNSCNMRIMCGGGDDDNVSEGKAACPQHQFGQA
jgi:hypothetical protein